MSKYQLVPKKGKEKFIVTIVTDMNDGDYLTNINEYSKEDFEGKLVDELVDLNKILRKSNELEDYEEKGYANIPFDTQTGEPCHTLEELIVEYVDKDGKVFDVVLSN